ncbi:MAG: tripartite tricarboxylate transporter substrate binding protein [Planctomycetales bacterium]
MRNIRKLLLIGWGLALCGCGESPGPQSYPKRPIKLIVPFSAGGGTDAYARIFEKAIDDAELLPQPLVIINLGGAGATIGSRRVKNAKPDGYTMLLLHNAIITAKYSGAADYGPEAFEPVAGTGEVGMVVTVHEDSKFKTLDDLLDELAKNPDTVTFGANIGAVTHFVGLQLQNQREGAEFRFVQSGDGADRFSHLVGGSIAVSGFSIEEFTRFRSKGLRGLAFFGDQRHPAAEDVPTAKEQGYDLVSTNTFYWWTPKGTPPERVQVLAEALRKALKTEYVQKKMEEIHCKVLFLEGEALQASIDRTTQQMASVDLQQPKDLPNLPAFVMSVASGLLLLIGAATAWEWKTNKARGLPDSLKEDVESETKPTPHWGLALASAALALLYVGSMTAGWVSFRIATTAFVLLLCGTLTRFHWKDMLVALIIAFTTGFGLHFVFTKVLVTDLP